MHRTDPSRVLAVASEGTGLAGLLEQRDLAVEAVPDAEAALAALGGDGEAPIQSVVAVDRAPRTDGGASLDPDAAGRDDEEPDPVRGVDGVALAERVREAGPELPIVLAMQGALGSRAEAAIAADVTATAPLAEPETVADAVQREASSAREQRRERERLEQDAQMLDTLLSNIPLSVYFKDRQHRHVRVSDAMICAEDPELFLENDEGKAHQHPADLLGKTDYDILGPAAEQAILDDRRVMESEETILDKIEGGQTRLGEQAYYSTSKAPWYDEDGAVAGVVGVTIDVSDRMRYRRDLEQQNARLEEFASMVSHDLRNPVSILSGYLEVLREGYDETAVEHCVDAAERMEELIEEILAFARHGQAVVDPDLLDLEGIAQDAWAGVETGAASLEVDVELPVRADRARLTRVLENCFRNAVEHGGPGVTVRVVDDGTDFYVEDDGPGINPDRREAVFERGVTSAESGTGFGLATVRAIAEAHGWTVSAEEGTDGGARIRFSGVARADQH